MKKLLLAAIVLGGCATGYGEAATGFVEASLVPGGDASGGVRFHRALLSVGHFDLEASEAKEPAEDDHGHSHGHQHLLLEATEEPSPGGVVDLLGGESPLGRIEVPVGHYQAAHLELEPATSGPAAGCAFFATGEVVATAAPVRICVPGSLLAELPLSLEVELDQTASLRIFVAVNGLLGGLSLDALEAGAGGGITIDAKSNTQALETIREALTAAISVVD